MSHSERSEDEAEAVVLEALTKLGCPEMTDAVIDLLNDFVEWADEDEGDDE